MQKINKERGSLSLIVSVIVVILVLGGGVYLYMKSPKADKLDNQKVTNVETYSVDDPVFASSPKGLFLKRNTELYSAQSFDEMMEISKKYDTEARRKENESVFREANDDKKAAYFGFAQSLMIPTEDFTQVLETIDGDTATVTAFDNHSQKTVASFIKENGNWKIIDIKTILTGSNK